jgi:hypothetical protein
MLEVDFYKASNGKCPVARYIDSLGAKQAKKVAWVLNVVESLDQVPTDYLKKLSLLMIFGKSVFSLLPIFFAF